MKKKFNKYILTDDLKKIIKKESSKRFLPVFLIMTLILITMIGASFFLILKKHNKLMLSNIDFDEENDEDLYL